MRLLTVLLFGVFLVATQVFLVLKAMQDNLFERDVDPVDAVMERQASISDELTPQERLWLSKNPVSYTHLDVYKRQDDTYAVLNAVFHPERHPHRA